MAYGNWGAFVKKNGERQKDHEDNTPYRETELDAGYWQAFCGERLGLNAYHATLGDKDVRLCGYKCYPALFNKGKKLDIEEFRVFNDDYPKSDDPLDDSPRLYQGKIEGHEFKATTSDNFVELYLKTPAGDTWTSTCGYQYGAGHMD